MSEFDSKLEYLEFYNSEFGVGKHCTKSWGFESWNHQQKKIDELSILVNELELKAESLECVEMLLDDRNIPKKDDNDVKYSVVGRIFKLIEKYNISNDDIEQLYWVFDKDRSCGIGERLAFKDSLKSLLIKKELLK